MQRKTTLDAVHQRKMSEINDNTRVLEEKRQRLNILTGEHEKLENHANDFVTIERCNLIAEKIHQLKREIEKLEEKSTQQYYLDTGLLLNEYYNKRDQTEQSETINVFDIFVQSRRQSDKAKANRIDLYDEYMIKTDPTCIKTIHKLNGRESCSNCGHDRVQVDSESLCYCPNCGLEEALLIDTEYQSAMDGAGDSSNFPYQRKHHFSEILSLLQARESSDIPQEVLDNILLEMKKEGLNDLTALTRAKVRKYLEKYSDRGFSKYYEHASLIINRLNGLPPKTMTPEMEASLNYWFNRLQEPYEMHRQNRRNFPSYKYVLHKLCEFLGYKEFIDEFPLLKSKDKLREIDKIWKKLCDEIGIIYVSSFK